MDIIITYDIEANGGEAKNSAVKEALKKEQYFDYFTITDQSGIKTTHYLPNTSLWKKETTAAIAKADLLRVAKANGAVVERLLATQFVNWDSIPGKAYVKKHL